VEPATIKAGYAGGNYSFEVTGGPAWTAGVSSGATWCDVTPKTGTGKTTITVTVAPSEETEIRTATISVSTGASFKTVTITQDASPLYADPAFVEAGYAEDTYPINVISALDGEWTATSSDPTWCFVSPTKGGAGTTSVSVKVLDNPNLLTDRPATITLSGGGLTSLVAVTQAGLPVILTLDREIIYEKNYAVAEYDVTVTSNAPWTVSAPATDTWCTIEGPTITSGHDGTFKVKIGDNSTNKHYRETAVIITAAGVEEYALPVSQVSGPVATPQKANSGTVWTFGESPLVWSDFIVMQGCDGSAWNTYNDGAFTDTHPVCASASTYIRNEQTVNFDHTYYYYNWPYVIEHQAEMCEDPWRVPTKADLDALMMVSSESELLQTWDRPGSMWGLNNFATPGGEFVLWSTTSSTAIKEGHPTAYYMRMGGPYGGGISDEFRGVGGMVRCVRL
jgi:hypothetical protein